MGVPVTSGRHWLSGIVAPLIVAAIFLATVRFCPAGALPSPETPTTATSPSALAPSSSKSPTAPLRPSQKPTPPGNRVSVKQSPKSPAKPTPPIPNGADGETQRVLGSSVVTSVSVKDVNETRSEGVSTPQKRPTIGSPAALLAPDRYEFYTFDETGDLVRRHMTLDEIKSLLAGGDGEMGDTPIATFYHGPVSAFSAAQSMHHSEDVLEDAVKGVQDVVNNVQNVLKSQLAATKNKLPAYIPAPKPAHNAPSPSQAAATWGMILPGIMDTGLPALPAYHKTSPTTTKTPSTVRRPAPVPGFSKKPVHGTTPKKPISKPKPAEVSTTSSSALKEQPKTTTPRITKPRRPTISTTHGPLTSFATSPVSTSPSPEHVIGSVYTLVSSSPVATSLKYTASNNASDTSTVPNRPSKPSRPAPTKPVMKTPSLIKPTKPPTETIPFKKPQAQVQAESMVKIVTIQKPLSTSTMPPTFVTFISADFASTAKPFVTDPVKEISADQGTTIYKYPYTTKFPGMSTLSKIRPSPNLTTPSPSTIAIDYTSAEEKQSSIELESTAEEAPDSRTTEDDSSSIDREALTTILPTTAKVTLTGVTITTPSSEEKHESTEQPPSSEKLVTFTPDLSEATSSPKLDMGENAPSKSSETFTKVPDSALITKYNSNEVEHVTRDEYITPDTTTVEPSTTRTSLTSTETTIQDEIEYAESDLADISSNSVTPEQTTVSNEDNLKVYLKISSSESKYPTSSLPETSSEISTESVSEETVSSSASSEDFTSTDIEETSDYPMTISTDKLVVPERISTTQPSIAETGLSSSETSASDQVQSSTEAKTTAIFQDITTPSIGDIESRTEATMDLDSVKDTSVENSKIETSIEVSTKAATERVSSTTAFTASSALAELKSDSSNIESTRIHLAGQSKPIGQVTVTFPTIRDQENKINSVPDRNKVEAMPVKPSALNQHWTRVPAAPQTDRNNSSGNGTEYPISTTSTTTEGAVALKHDFHGPQYNSPSSVELHAAPHESLGLEASTTNIDPDIRSFVNLCNELAFQMWMSIKEKSSSTASRSIVVSPFAATSTLAMVFLGARGPTSGQMNDVLRLDDMVSFNPHQVMWNVTESLIHGNNPGVATAALVRELYSDKNKGKLLDFYKERAQQFYDGHVEEISFRQSGDLVRRKTNLLVKRQTRGRVQEYMRGSSLALRPPLAVFGANIFETDCTGASTEGRDGEMHFVVVPSSRQRRLVPVPAVVWRSGFLAGYDPALDATVVSLGPADAPISTLMVLPGQQGQVAPGDGLTRLEQRLLESRGPSARWARLLRTLLPRPGLQLQIPRFSHRSVLNMSAPLQRMGLDELFSSERADLRGLNGIANDLHLSDVVQLNTFSTCGERALDSRHHVEFFPTSPLTQGRRSARGRRLRPKVSEGQDPSIVLHPENVGKDRDNFYSQVGDALEAAEARGWSGLTSSEEAVVSESTGAGKGESRDSRTFQRIADFEDPDLMKVPLALRPRQARIPEAARLRFDRPFLFFVRHNPTGILLHMGRFNPRLLP